MQLNIFRTFTHTDFFKGLLLTFAISAPLAAAYWYGDIALGIGMALGVLMCSASDVPGSYRHRSAGILSAALLAASVTLIMGLVVSHSVVLLFTIGIISFAASFLSVFGFRASLVAFAGLMAVVLSLVSVREGSVLLWHSAGVFAGGVWYLLLSTGFNFVTERKQANQLLADCLEYTVNFLTTQSKVGRDERSVKKSLSLQASLNEVHETLRELMLEKRRHSGASNYYNRQLMLFTELVDIYELSLGETGAWETASGSMASYGEALPLVFHEFHREITSRLRDLEHTVRNGTNPPATDRLQTLAREAKASITDFIERRGLPDGRSGALAMHNLLDYLLRLTERTETMARILGDLSEQRKLLPPARRGQFITQQDYSARRLLENLDINSPIFRHSLRMALTMMAGFLIGRVFQIQNAYWILLTIVVIMRPNYSLTKQRAIQRLYGTLIGAGVAVLIVLLTQNAVVYGILGLLSMVLAFTYIRKNYRISSVFITLGIVFIYVLIQPDAFTVIQYRVLDTLTGAALAFLANTFLLPSWEYENIARVSAEAARANGHYLSEVSQYYRDGGEITDEYRLARKKAFLAVGNLNAAFQRMSQDPKTKQPELALVYEVTALNQSFLTAVASLGAYMRNHPTGTAKEAVGMMTEAIRHKLAEAYDTGDRQETAGIEEGRHMLMNLYMETTEERDREIAGGKRDISQDMLNRLQEIKIITDQLNWLYSMGQNLGEKSRKLPVGQTA
ncbi:MAG: FUSC family protein [Cyclobacteriaceae bacterium]